MAEHVIKDDKGRFRLPFNQFRYWFPPCPVTEKDPEPFTAQYGYAYIDENNHLIQHGYASWKLRNGLTESHIFTTESYIDYPHIATAVQLYCKVHGWKHVEKEADVKILSANFVRPIFILSWLYSSGFMQPVTVSPPQAKAAAHPVKWKQAREYYTVVHRRHEANSKHSKEGQTYLNKTNILTAHARRAHTRILKSPRWGASMGKQVWVRSAWVGPRQWIDHASKQIYRVANL
jgi:hypothetical protein